MDSNNRSRGLGWTIKEKLKDIAWSFSGKGTAPSMSVNKKVLIAVLIGALIIAAFALKNPIDDSPSSDDEPSVDRTQGLSITQYSADVLSVRNGTNRAAGDLITYGEAFDYYFSDGKWSSFISEDDQSIVDFSGTCIYKDEEYNIETDMNTYMQFILHDDGCFELYYMSFNDVAQDEISMASMLMNVFETYAEDNGIDISGDDEDSQEQLSTTEDVDDWDLENYIGDWKVEEINAFFTISKDSNGYYFDLFGTIMANEYHSNVFIYDGYNLNDERPYITLQPSEYEVWATDFSDSWGNVGIIFLYPDGDKLWLSTYLDETGVECPMEVTNAQCIPNN